MPADIIAPLVLTPGGLLVVGGAPKVGKSDFLISWLVHMAAGAPFLGFTPPRRLRVFYLQAEIQYHYLRERVEVLREAINPDCGVILVHHIKKLGKHRVKGQWVELNPMNERLVRKDIGAKHDVERDRKGDVIV